MDKINKVAVFGMGKSGKAALILAIKKGLDAFAVNKGVVASWYQDEKLNGIITAQKCFSEDEFIAQFAEMDLIVLSPGIPTTHPSLRAAVARGVPVISEIEFAYRYTRHIPVIAVTGTNGKTTTTTMIEEALRLAGKRVFCGGNIGVPYCELAVSQEAVDYAVIEVSSFQLETIKEFHPVMALILNVFPNHSERYDHVSDYAKAKNRILLNMGKNDHLILGTENEFLDEPRAHPASKTFFTKGDLPKAFREKFNFTGALVKGEHNEANFYAAYCVLEKLKIPTLDSLFQKFIDSFKGVAHRLEFVLTHEGLTVYNDAKSTNGLATTTAIKAFKDSREPLYLILGGKLRNEADTLLPDLLPYRGRIREIFTIGEVTERLYQELHRDFEVVRCFELKKVLEEVRGRQLKGNLVFSPAFPSFDQFRNYVDRGEKFKAWALETF
ncbi:MAG TPA: UDP-N-acetylmuramoyl-L-alanine--D-glutamate ligase [Bacteriovoracaceae bacterium]|nr:UDP-N-acetylmuramoyl-L-alanine--D-glutamate ligase [Bacteriovoracaceae bacterium]